MKLKRVLSLLLVVVMLATLAPVSVFADKVAQTVAEDVEEEENLRAEEPTASVMADVTSSGNTGTVTLKNLWVATQSTSVNPWKDVGDGTYDVFLIASNSHVNQAASSAVSFNTGASGGSNPRSSQLSSSASDQSDDVSILWADSSAQINGVSSGGSNFSQAGGYNYCAIVGPDAFTTKMQRGSSGAPYIVVKDGQTSSSSKTGTSKTLTFGGYAKWIIDGILQTNGNYSTTYIYNLGTYTGNSSSPHIGWYAYGTYGAADSRRVPFYDFGTNTTSTNYFSRNSNNFSRWLGLGTLERGSDYETVVYQNLGTSGVGNAFSNVCLKLQTAQYVSATNLLYSDSTKESNFKKYSTQGNLFRVYDEGRFTGHDNNSNVTFYKQNTNCNVTLSFNSLSKDTNSDVFYSDDSGNVYFNGKSSGTLSFATTLTDDLGGSYTSGVSSFKNKTDFTHYTYGAQADRSATITVTDTDGILNYTQGAESATFNGKRGKATVTVTYNWKDTDGTTYSVSKTATIVNASYWVDVTLFGTPDGDQVANESNNTIVFNSYLTYGGGLVLRAELKSDLNNSNETPKYVPAGAVTFNWSGLSGAGSNIGVGTGNKWSNAIAFNTSPTEPYRTWTDACDSVYKNGTLVTTADQVEIVPGGKDATAYFTLTASIGGAQFIQSANIQIANHPIGIDIKIDGNLNDSKELTNTSTSYPAAVTLKAYPTRFKKEYDKLTNVEYSWTIPNGTNYKVTGNTSTSDTVTVTFNGLPTDTITASLKLSKWSDDFNSNITTCNTDTVTLKKTGSVSASIRMTVDGLQYDSYYMDSYKEAPNTTHSIKANVTFTPSSFTLTDWDWDWSGTNQKVNDSGGMSETDTQVVKAGNQQGSANIKATFKLSDGTELCNATQRVVNNPVGLGLVINGTTYYGTSSSNVAEVSFDAFPATLTISAITMKLGVQVSAEDAVLDGRNWNFTEGDGVNYTYDSSGALGHIYFNGLTTNDIPLTLSSKWHDSNGNTDQNAASAKVIIRKTGTVTFNSTINTGDITFDSLTDPSLTPKSVTVDVTSVPPGVSLTNMTDGYWAWSSTNQNVAAVDTTQDNTGSSSSRTVSAGSSNGTATVSVKFISATYGDPNNGYVVAGTENSFTVTNRKTYTLDLKLSNVSGITVSNAYANSLTVSGAASTDKLKLQPVLKCEGCNYEINAPTGGTFTWSTTASSGYVLASTNGSTNTVNFTGYGSGENKTVSLSYSYNGKTYSDSIKITAYQNMSEAKSVIISYGIPMDIKIKNNETVAGISKTAPSVALVTGRTANNECANTSVTFTGGKAAITKSAMNDNVITFTPSVSTTGIAASAAVIYYSNNITASGNTVSGYKYSSVTVVPASTVYYEDTDSVFSYEGDWGTVGTALTAKSIVDLSTAIYTDNSSAYENAGNYSRGSARKATVNKDNTGSVYATFTFTGTGFDIISRTGNDCGFVTVEIYSGTGIAGSRVKSFAVDTYRGYTLQSDKTNPYVKYTWAYNDEGEWHVSRPEGYSTENEQKYHGGVPCNYNEPLSNEYTGTPNPKEKTKKFVTFEKNLTWTATTSGENGYYQIPVLTYDGLTKGTYTVKITPMYSQYLAQNGATSYSFYLDAVRVHGANDGVAAASYSGTKEAYTTYVNLRKQLVSQSTFSTSSLGSDLDGLALFDGYSGDSATIEDYKDYGANNEIYLKPGQGIVFNMRIVSDVAQNTGTNADKVQLGVKALKGSEVNTSSTDDTSKAHVTVTSKVTGGSTTTQPFNIKSVSELYYTVKTGYTTAITVVNDGDYTVSLTNLKVCFKTATDSIKYINVDKQTVASAQTAARTMLMMAKAPAAPTVFDPEISVSAPEKVTVGDTVKLSVTTSDDVAYITVNGEKVSANENFVWCYETLADKAGEMSFEVKAYNAKDEEGESVKTATVTVEPEPFTPTVNVFAPAAVIVGDTVNVTVTTSDDVAYITVNGERVTENNNFVWSYSVPADTVGTMVFAVKVYSEWDTESENAPVASVTVMEKPFAPSFSVDAPDTVTVGDTVTVTVTTSDEVAYITVNGVTVSENDNFVWTYSAAAEEVGEMSFEVKVYNADGKAAEAVRTATVTVEEAPVPFEPLVNLMVPATAKVGETVTVQVVTSSDVAYITVNGVKVESHSDSFVWTYELTADSEGELDITVVAYNEDGEAAENEQTATVSVTNQVKSAWEIIVDAIKGFFKKLLGGN